MTTNGPLPDIDWKAAFRKRARTERTAAKAGDDGTAAARAAKHFIDSFAPKAPAKIALYCPLGDELDTAYLNADLLALGHQVLLPVVTAADAPLIFRAFRMDTPLEEGRFGIPVPPESAEEITPEFLVVPLLGIRRDGARLGMGGGYYDRTLKALREDGDVPAIGFGYAAQKMDRFPVMAHDEFLDGFVSEEGSLHFDRRR